MFDFNYHVTLKLIKNHIFGVKMSSFFFFIFLHNVIMNVIT